METRIHEGIEQHKHEGYNYWHTSKRIHMVVCNFKYFNGLVDKCSLKTFNKNSAGDYETCDGSKCVLMKLLNGC